VLEDGFILIAQLHDPALRRSDITDALDKLAHAVVARMAAAAVGRDDAAEPSEAGAPAAALPGCRVTVSVPQALAAVNHVLFVEHSFRGNAQRYYDPRNSLLQHVLSSRMGLPITLCAVYAAVCRRAGVPGVMPVGMPGHFILKFDPHAAAEDEAAEELQPHGSHRASAAEAAPGRQPWRLQQRPAVLVIVLANGSPEIFIDAFQRGEFLSRADLVARLAAAGVPNPDDPAHLAATPLLEAWARGLRNLVGSYDSLGVPQRKAECMSVLRHVTFGGGIRRGRQEPGPGAVDAAERDAFDIACAAAGLEGGRLDIAHAHLRYLEPSAPMEARAAAGAPADAAARTHHLRRLLAAFQANVVATERQSANRAALVAAAVATMGAAVLAAAAPHESSLSAQHCIAGAAQADMGCAAHGDAVAMCPSAVGTSIGIPEAVLVAAAVPPGHITHARVLACFDALAQAGSQGAAVPRGGGVAHTNNSCACACCEPLPSAALEAVAALLRGEDDAHAARQYADAVSQPTATGASESRLLLGERHSELATSGLPAPATAADAGRRATATWSRRQGRQGHGAVPSPFVVGDIVLHSASGALAVVIGPVHRAGRSGDQLGAAQLSILLSNAAAGVEDTPIAVVARDLTPAPHTQVREAEVGSTSAAPSGLDGSGAAQGGDSQLQSPALAAGDQPPGSDGSAGGQARPDAAMRGSHRRAGSDVSGDPTLRPLASGPVVNLQLGRYFVGFQPGSDNRGSSASIGHYVPNLELQASLELSPSD
jgi:hypothetical protein